MMSRPWVRVRGLIQVSAVRVESRVARSYGGKLRKVGSASAQRETNLGIQDTVVIWGKVSRVTQTIAARSRGVRVGKKKA
jgi:hypothetical protein